MCLHLLVNLIMWKGSFYLHKYSVAVMGHGGTSISYCTCSRRLWLRIPPEQPFFYENRKEGSQVRFFVLPLIKVSVHMYLNPSLGPRLFTLHGIVIIIDDL